MRIILDTGVFFHPDTLEMMRWYVAPVIVPAVVYAERVRQIGAGGGDIARFDRLLDGFGAIVEPMGPDEATRYTRDIADDHKWLRLARDALIAGHVGPEDRLFTTNPKDFIEVGVPERQVLEIPRWAARARRQARKTRPRG